MTGDGGTKDGLGAAAEAAAAALGVELGAAPAAGGGDQVELPGLEGEAPAAGEGQAVAPAGPLEGMVLRRGAGRPPGSRNRRTEEMRDYLLAQYSHPLLVLADLYSRPVDDLALHLSCKREEAMRLQVRAAEIVAPYVAQKLPIAVDVSAKGVVSLTIAVGEGADPAAGDGPEGAITINGEVVEDQGVTRAPPGELDKGELDNDG